MLPAVTTRRSRALTARPLLGGCLTTPTRNLAAFPEIGWFLVVPTGLTDLAWCIAGLAGFHDVRFDLAV